jgi:hypothetical protein
VYRERNKQKISESGKLYYMANKELIDEKSKKYRMDHLEEIRLKASEKLECPCGSCFRRDKKSRHEKTKKHLKYIQPLEK